MLWNCLKTLFFSLIIYVDFFACERWINIFFHSKTPKSSFRCSSLLFSFLNPVHLWHSNRTCRNVWDLWPHSPWLLFTNFRLYKKIRRSIFPVLICVMSVLSSFLILLCSCKTLLLGMGVAESWAANPDVNIVAYSTQLVAWIKRTGLADFLLLPD